MNYIDLRSDTVTKPTPEMRKAMFEAEVGDDVYHEDPTVTALEKRTAEILGKEAAIFMPSGTMTNQVAIRCHTEPGDEVLMDVSTHIYFYEVGAPGALSGVMCRLIPGIRGIFTGRDVEVFLRAKDIYFPPTRLICVENTHNRGGGSIWPLEQIASVAAAAKRHNLIFHMDGARLWNASAETGISEADYCGYFDTVSVCYSKGLGAPIGSALAGSAEFVERARRFRKQFGGGMRQAGFIAAGALYALEHHRARLVADHTNARLFAEGICDLPGIDLDPATVQTNIVKFRVSSGSPFELVEKLKAAGVLMSATDVDTIRAVTHLDVTREEVEHAVEIFRSIMERNGL